MKKLKNIIWSLIAVLIVAGVCFLLFGENGHIEDKNGENTISLNTITNKNIIKENIKTVGEPKITHTKLFKETIKFNTKKFSGIYEIVNANYNNVSDFIVNISDFELKEGNLKMVVVHNKKIVKTIKLKKNIKINLKDVRGDYSLRIAGESASFTFSMNPLEYEKFQ